MAVIRIKPILSTVRFSLFGIIACCWCVSIAPVSAGAQRRLAPASFFRLNPSRSDLDIIRTRIEVFQRRKLTPAETGEVERLLEWIKPLRETVLSDTVLCPQSDVENYGRYLRRIRSLVVTLAESDITRPSSVDIKFNPDLDGGGWSLMITYRQAPVFSFAYFPVFSVDSREMPGSERLSVRFENAPFFISKCAWVKNPVLVNGELEPRILKNEGYTVRGIPVTPSKRVWINPYGHADEHLVDFKRTAPVWTRFTGNFVVQPVSPRVHTSQQTPVDPVFRQSNLTPDPHAIPSIVIGDLHSDRPGLENILSFLRRAVIPASPEDFEWSDPESYEIDESRLKELFPEGLRIISVGDHFGRQRDLREMETLIRILFTLQEKFERLPGNYSVIPLAGNYEVASAMNAPELLESGFNPSFFGRLNTVFRRFIRPFLDRKDADAFNQFIFHSVFDEKRIRAAAVVDHRLVIHGGLTNELAAHLVRKLASEKRTYPEDVDPMDRFVPRSKKLLEAGGESTDPDSIYLEDLADYINEYFFRLFDRDPASGPFTKLYLQGEWGDLFFGVSGRFDFGSIIEGRPADFTAKPLIVSQVSGHSAVQFLTAPLTVSFDGKRIGVDTEFNRQFTSNFLYVDSSGYYQITHDGERVEDIDEFYRKTLRLTPSDEYPEEVETTMPMEEEISVRIEQGLRMRIQQPSNRYSGADVTAVLASLGLGIESLKTEAGPQGAMIYDIHFQILRLESIAADSEETMFRMLQEEIVRGLKSLRDKRTEKNGDSNSRIYWETFLRGSLQASGMNRYYFSRVSDVETALYSRERMDEEAAARYRDLLATNPGLEKASFFRLVTSERFGLLHLLYRLLEEESGYRIRYMSARTVEDSERTYADDFFFLVHLDGSKLAAHEINRLRRRLKNLLDENVIDGRLIGMPERGFEIETLGRISDGLPKIQSLSMIGRAS